MRKIFKVLIHCSDSDVKSHDNIETIKDWHTLPKMPSDITQRIKDGKLPKSEAYKYGNGWKDIGYHYFIDKTGGVFPGRSEDIAGAHVRGHNSGSIGICLSGRREFTDEQFRALELLCLDITQRYDLEKKDILAHNDLDANKTCPNFDLHKLISSWKWH
jgi:N-acetylmuramoyl-L-alanine amidase